jgi:hypothetical protein
MNATEYIKANKHLRNNQLTDKDLIIILDGFLCENRKNTMNFDSGELFHISKSLENSLFIQQRKVNKLETTLEKANDGREVFLIEKQIRRQKRIVQDLENLISKVNENKNN